jgi:hypothetical protein
VREVRLDIPLVDRGDGPAHHVEVLLRHRPRSIP